MVKYTVRLQRRFLPAMRIIVGAASLGLPGCSGQAPLVMLDTPTGPVTLNAPQPAMTADMAGPPPGLEPAVAMSVPGSAVGRDGSYAGTADVLSTDGGVCIENQRVGGFRVHGDAVRYGRFRGRIAPDGGLQMVYGQDWIVGQFEGATFHGQLDLQGRFESPGCTYMLNLQRVGP
jgi:hypothetical protein